MVVVRTVRGGGEGSLVRLEPRFTSHRSGDVRDSEADITEARRDLGYVPIVGLHAGPRETIEWIWLERTGLEPSIRPLGVLDPALVALAHGRNAQWAPRMDLGFVRVSMSIRRQLAPPVLSLLVRGAPAARAAA